jgi:hypothetical protein
VTFTTTAGLRSEYETVRADIIARLGTPGRKVRLSGAIWMQVQLGDKWFNVTEYKVDMIHRMYGYRNTVAVPEHRLIARV